eukprot:TRINITY_DN7016_c0_g1_i1.p1 TRINITY_DN7016_c0_g1~~TRINITY_DN7016_c0_g1_i1.p1  ORF type:complete len:824 (+),score=156.08 TRINITY_DN7016_c0_g1_i1:79-2550(+)
MEDQVYIPQEPGIYSRVKAAVAYLQPRLGKASIGVILGTGLNHLVDILQDKKSVAFEEIPYMPITTVTGHAGKFVSGRVGGKDVFCLMGRVHGYEGHQASALTFATRILVELGMKILITTNAAGGAILDMPPGSLMVIHSHINVTRRDPLRDSFQDRRLGAKVVQASDCYSERISTLAHEVAQKQGFQLFDGVYCWTTGPTYETATEVQAAMKMGGHAFGMSTVPEVLAARSLGVEVFALSMVTNLATGLSSTLLSHEEVKAMGVEHSGKIEAFVVGIITALNESESTAIAFNCSESALTSPKAANVVPTAQQISEAAKFLSAISHGKAPKTVAALQAWSKPSIKKMEVIYEIELRDIPYLPIVSDSAIKGKLLLALCGESNAVYVLTVAEEEGFTPYESYFLANLFSKLGVSEFMLTATAGHMGGDDVGDVVAVSDIFNWTCTINHRDNTQTLFTGSLHGAASNFLKKSKTYFWLSGPCLESKGEINVARTVGVDLIGISNMTILLAFASNQIETACVAGITHKCGDIKQALPESLAEKVFEILSSTHTASNGKLHESNSPSVTCPPSQSAQLGKDSIRLAQDYIKHWLGDSHPTAAVYYYAGDKIVETKDIEVKSVSFGEIPGMPSHGRLTLAKLSGVPTLWVESEMSVSRGDSVADIVLPARVLRDVGISKVYFASKVLQSIQQKEIGFTLLKDHINYSGYHALCGHNVDEWGTRFPDMTHAYNEAVWTPILEKCKESDVVPEFAVAYFLADNLYTPITRKGASNFGAQVITDAVVQEDIALRHMTVETACFAISVPEISVQIPKSVADKFNAVLRAALV